MCFLFQPLRQKLLHLHCDICIENQEEYFNENLYLITQYQYIMLNFLFCLSFFLQ